MKKIIQKIKLLWEAFKALSVIKKIIIILVILGLGLFIKSKFSSEEAIQYSTSTVSLGNVALVVSETGEISTTSQVSVPSTITGLVTEVYVENGKEVTRGQSLFYVESSATSEQRASAYASYLKAKDSLEAAKSSAYSLESAMWKAHETFEDNALEEEMSVDDPIYIEQEREWLAAEQKYIDQKAVIAQAEASVTSAWFAYQATIDGPVTAPISGKAVNIAVATGQQVSNSDAALLIKGESETWVVVTITETDISDVAVGQETVVSIDALDGREISGEVRRVDEIGTVNSGVVTYSAYIALNDDSETPEDELAGVLPAMTVQVDIQASKAENVVVVPNGAIKPYRGGKAVQVLNEKTGELLYMPIEIGIVGITETEVISGISEGDEIVISTSSSSDSDKQGGGLFSGPGK
jgi:macrolide-specific efflux system membrane fusion protein